MRSSFSNVSRAGVAGVFLALTLLGCVHIQPEWKFDPDLDLSGRDTFHIAPTGDAPTGLSSSDQELWTARRELIRGLIRDDLVGKAYREVATDAKAKLHVHFFAGSGMKGMETFHETERSGKIDIRFSDPATGAWLWHGWATETLVEQLDENQEIREAVPLILSKFPRAS